MDEQEKVNYEERDRLLYELVVRQSALEKALLKSEILTEKDLAEAQVECMEKLKSIMDQHQKEPIATVSSGGFIKYGEKYEDHDWSHESRKKE
jgi:hypothetical protein